METVIASMVPVLDSVRSSFMSRKNVLATGIGYKVTEGEKTGQLSIVCSVERKEAQSALSSADLLPKNIDGIPTDVVATGKIRSLQQPTGRFRPAPGGVSIGHFEITAGTLGCLVRKQGKLYILSNNHVLANSNDASVGDPILQPAPYDGGKNPTDRVAELSAFIPVNYTSSEHNTCPIANGIADTYNLVAQLTGGNSRLQAVTVEPGRNLVDAALARPLKPEDFQSDILGIGTIAGTTEGTLGMAIKKSGRTTGVTQGEIQQVNVTVNVNYGNGRIAQFHDQLLAGAMSQGGDSGSAVLDDKNNLVGLLFAGSDQSTIINRIQHVFELLEVSL